MAVGPQVLEGHCKDCSLSVSSSPRVAKRLESFVEVSHFFSCLLLLVLVLLLSNCHLWICQLPAFGLCIGSRLLSLRLDLVGAVGIHQFGVDSCMRAKI